VLIGAIVAASMLATDDRAPMRNDATPAPVAVLLDDAGGVYRSERLETGQDVPPGALELDRGTIELQMPGGSSVTLTGPVSCELIGPGVMRLTRGQLRAEVADGGAGFTVHTPDATVVDLGTAFELSVEPGAGTSVEVRGDGEPIRLSAGDRASVREGRLLDHRIASAPATGGIDLADVIAGGDGTGVATDRGIDLRDGRLTADWYTDESEPAAGYRPVAGSAMIDGVFVPDGPDTAVSSTGLIGADLPATTGVHWSPIWAFGPAQPTDRQWLTLIKPYRARRHIAMHANAGVTIDLAAIGESGARALRGEVGGAPLGALSKSYPPSARVHVLVDGRVAWTHTIDKAGVWTPIDLTIEPAARFLTLAVTDDGDWEYDTVLFTDLRLTQIDDPRGPSRPTEPTR